MLRAVEKLLVKNEIEPAAELVPRFDDLPGEREPESLVHTDAGGIVGINARDHGRIACSVRRLQQLFHQPGGDVAPPEALMHINGCLLYTSRCV